MSTTSSKTATPNQQPILAAIDLGSNSFRLEIGRLESGQIERIEYIKEAVRQGGDLDEERNLTEESIERGLKCLARFGERIKGFDKANVRAVATQTLREANNRDVFTKAAKKALGFDVEVISGVEEARLIYQGVSRFLPQSNDRRIVIDVGGRSTELILGLGFNAVHTASLHVGSVAWSLKHFANGEFTERAFERAEIAAESIFETLGNQFNPKNWDIAYGASGTVGAVADVLAQYDRPADTISREGLLWLREELIKHKTSEKLKLNGLREDRKAVIGGGLSILLAIFDFLHLDTMHVAKGALRHGLLYDMLARENTMVDLRNQSVNRLAKKFIIDELHAETVADVAVKLFDKVTANTEFDAQSRVMYRRKLHWAGLLHEIGCIVSPIDSHLHGAYILDHTEPQGFSQSELHCLSMLILGHKGKLKKLEVDFSDHAFVMQLLCLRLAVLFCHARKMPNLRGIQLNTDRQTISLTLPKNWSKKFPQSYYLLDEEMAIWQKIDWSLSLVTQPTNQ
jgi:exopolyphosphatase / guanosine-5'-triphosphate,3'-diphosphate pyrophosphatase